MLRHFTMEYWQDGKWYVGKLKEIPGLFSQGATLQELEGNIGDAYRLLLEDQEPSVSAGILTKEIGLEV